MRGAGSDRRAGLGAQPRGRGRLRAFCLCRGGAGQGQGRGFKPSLWVHVSDWAGWDLGRGLGRDPLCFFDSCLSYSRSRRVGLRTCGPALCASPSPRGPSPGHEAHLLLLQLTSGGRCRMSGRRAWGWDPSPVLTEV